MTRKTIKPYLFLLAFLLLIMSISPLTSEKFREKIVKLMTTAHLIHSSHSIPNSELDLQKLRLENQLLKEETQRLKNIVQNERRLINAFKKDSKQSSTKECINHHLESLQRQMEYQFSSIPAKVIYRSSSSWKSSLWLNVGKATNETLKRKVVAKDSPVVVGNAIIGVVDYVGEQQSRVRLISDSGLCPSVRAVRGSIQKSQLCDSMTLLIDQLKNYQKTPLTDQLTQALNNLKEDGAETWYLAKGELRGCNNPLWRSTGTLLQGVGFNYDFSDEYGPARDLRSGLPLNSKSKESAIPLLKENDLLVTTGMDGVFPAGLYVAEVVKISPLQEGDYTYDLEARPLAGNLEELALVYVMPPLGYDPNDQPSPIGY